MSTTVTGLILIVDDIPTNLDVICETLNAAGFDLAIATSGERALQQIEREIPDLILLDIMMPGMNGFETCQRLKSNPLTGNIPIIFMTALADTDSKIKALELGAVDYITKPFQAKEVLARVRTHLELRRLTQSLEQKVLHQTAELQASQLQLIQTEKMSSLGNLIAGVAHEMNNPIGFLNGSLHHAKEYIQSLLGHLELYQTYYPDTVKPLQDNAEDIDLDFLSADLPKLIDSMQGAVDRIQSLSTSLRIFTRADSEHQVSANLHEGLDSTLLILKYRLKANNQRPTIEVIQDYGALPEVECFPNQLNQVFMNLLANAIDALDEVALHTPFWQLQTQPQTITIQTLVLADGNTIEIRIRDNGNGIPEELHSQIFHHSFTTKKAGKGTGLGLAIARQIIVEKHNGSLEVESSVGEGTQFSIRLPISS